MKVKGQEEGGFPGLGARVLDKDLERACPWRAGLPSKVMQLHQCCEG